MTRQLLQLLAIGAWLAVGILISGTAVAQVPTACAAGTNGQLSPPYNLPARFSYAAKFVCGVQDGPILPTNPPPPSEPPVKRGNYATLINIHNPQICNAFTTANIPVPVTITKKIALAARETFPNTKLITPSKRVCDTLPPDHAMSIDCTEIVNLLHLTGPTFSGTFIEGFVVIDAWCPGSAAGQATPVDIDVVTVTTSDTLPGLFFGFSNPHHDVNPVQGKLLTAGLWPF